VENRVIAVPHGLPPAALISASNYLNARLIGRTIEEAKAEGRGRGRLEQGAARCIDLKLVAAGLASWAGGEGQRIDRARPGQSPRGRDGTGPISSALRTLFEMLETRETMLRLLDASKQGKAFQIFIGAENRLFGSRCSMVIAPYQNSREQIVGAIGVNRPHPDQLCPYHPDGGLHRQGDRAPHRIGQIMHDTTKEQEQIPTPENAANTNFDGLAEAPIGSENEERSADDR